MVSLKKESFTTVAVKLLQMTLPPLLTSPFVTHRLYFPHLFPTTPMSPETQRAWASRKCSIPL